MSPASGIGVARLDQSGLKELTNRFEHPVTRLGIAMIGLDQGLVDEPRHEVEDTEPIRLVIATNDLGRFEREAAHHGQAVGEHSFVVVEELVAPRD